MDHLFRFQRSIHIKLTPVFRNGGQIQPLGSVLMILAKKKGIHARQEGTNVVFSQFTSISTQKTFVPQTLAQSVVTFYSSALQIMHQMPTYLGTPRDFHSDANELPMGHWQWHQNYLDFHQCSTSTAEQSAHS